MTRWKQVVDGVFGAELRGFAETLKTQDAGRSRALIGGR